MPVDRFFNLALAKAYFPHLADKLENPFEPAERLLSSYLEEARARAPRKPETLRRYLSFAAGEARSLVEFVRREVVEPTEYEAGEGSVSRQTEGLRLEAQRFADVVGSVTSVLEAFISQFDNRASGEGSAVVPEQKLFWLDLRPLRGATGAEAMNIADLVRVTLNRTAHLRPLADFLEQLEESIRVSEEDRQMAATDAELAVGEAPLAAFKVSVKSLMLEVEAAAGGAACLESDFGHLTRDRHGEERS